MVVKLAHDARLAQEIDALLLCVARFQRLDGHRDLLLAVLQRSLVDFPKLAWQKRKK